MSNFILSCCSTADLSLEYLLSRDIKYVCFHYFINDKEYLDDLGQTMSLAEFYRMMDEDDIMTRTSQINVTEYTEYFDKMLAEGNDILGNGQLRAPRRRRPAQEVSRTQAYYHRHSLRLVRLRSARRQGGRPA